MAGLLGSPAFLRLPREILDEVLSEVEAHKDLVNFALTSHACADLAIPRHSEYRTIRVCRRLPRMWEHLARRKDLARNVREVHICDPSDATTLDHFPTTLVPKQPESVGDLREEELRVKHMYAALRNMDKLRVFRWSCVGRDGRLSGYPTMTPMHEMVILLGLINLPMLKDVSLAGRFASMARDITIDPQSTRFPLWRLANLHTLTLSGGFWNKPSNLPHLKAMINRSPTLENLVLPLEVTALAECQLPALKNLKLVLESASTNMVRMDHAWSKFIGKHPTIEQLSWHTLGAVKFSEGTLPNLRRLQTDYNVLAALDEMMDGGAHSQIEALVLDVDDVDFLFAMENVLTGKLKKLFINNCGGAMDSTHLQRLAEKLPDLEWLSVRKLALSSDDCVANLARFPALEEFHGQALWQAVDGSKERMHQTIMELVQSCPRLRILDHCDYCHELRDCKNVQIIREVSAQGENVRYETLRPRPSFRKFDVFDGAFDV